MCSKHACCFHGPELPGEIPQGLQSSGDRAWPRHNLPTRGPATPPDLPDKQGRAARGPKAGLPLEGSGDHAAGVGSPAAIRAWK